MKRRPFLFATAALALILVTALGFGAYKASAAAICTPATAISVPFTKDGAGDFCYQTSNLCTYINSWNVTTIEVNGNAYTNIWVSSPSIAPVNGTYTIHYVSAVAWGHFEIGAPCGGSPTTPAPTTPPALTATRTLTPNALTPTRTATCACLPLTPTRTPTNDPTATRTATPTVGVPLTPTRTPTLINEPPLSNPFQGAVWYLNPDYTAQVNAQATATGGTLGAQMVKVAHYGTGIWLDSVDAVNGVNGYPRSLAGHLNAALAQNANLVMIVLYDLPNRNCGQTVSDGEFKVANNGLNLYKSEYIDLIAGIVSNPAYANLRIVAIIEPDSLPNLVYNLQTPACQEVNSSGAYVQGIQYALNKLRVMPNVYSYMDIGHSGVPGGWSQNMSGTTALYANTVTGTVAGANSINGFITNTANYSVTTEPFMTATQLISGQPVYSSSFFQWNPTIDETNYAATWKSTMINTYGFPASSANMVVDTSRNGWGGSSYGRARPTSPSTSTLLEDFVNQSRLDRRFDKGLWGWCNQAAGIGAVPQSSPSTLFQAYVWAMPPGISDGSSVAIPVGPQNPRGKAFHNMCDPNYGGTMDSIRHTGAMPNAPVAGAWFPEGFATLVANAYPPLP